MEIPKLADAAWAAYRAEVERAADAAIWARFVACATEAGWTRAPGTPDPDAVRQAAIVEALRDVVLANTEL